MWEFPNGRVNGDPARGIAKALKTGYNLRLRVIRNSRAGRRDGARLSRSRSADRQEPLGIVQHGYSHFSVTTHVFRCELLAPSEAPNLKWVPLKDLDSYPMGKIDRQIAKMIGNK
jgi:hypothetical protein